MPPSRRYPDRPFVGVGVVVLGSRGVLLTRRATPPRLHQWSLPGGAQELGETVEETARREVREETGLEIEDLRLIDAVDSITRDFTGRVEYHYTLIDFVARSGNGRLKAGGDASDARWFDADEIERADLWAATRRVIRLALA